MAEKMGVKVDLSVWMPLLSESQLTSLPHDTVLRGRLRSGLGPDAPEVLDALSRWPARAYLSTDDRGTEVILVYQLKEQPGSGPPWVHLGLLLATLLTTLGAGALMAGEDPFGTRILEVGGAAVPYPTTLEPRTLGLGLTFAIPFLGMLICHEMGHWWSARRHGVRATLPYFIPFPPYFSVIGSLGAFIRLRSPSVRRSVLFDIGAAGPIASFVVSVPMFALGLGLSHAEASAGSITTPFGIQFAGQWVWLGNGPLTHMLASAFGPAPPGEALVHLHPLALAGWLGLFVTALNLLPLGQLDGGHVLYSLFPARQERFARLFFLALFPLGLLWWGWWAWAVLVLVLHRGRAAHPSVLQPDPAIGAGRTVLGWALIVTFLLTFVPVPLEL